MFERPAVGKVTFDIGNCTVNLDMDRSGATMALDHWKPTGLTDTQRQLFLYVEDADLWQWKLPESKEFHAGVQHALKLCIPGHAPTEKQPHVRSRYAILMLQLTQYNICSRSAGLIDLNLDYDAASNAQIWDQLLELTPEGVIAKVRALHTQPSTGSTLHTAVLRRFTFTVVSPQCCH